jgi:hypothetical protein
MHACSRTCWTVYEAPTFCFDRLATQNAKVRPQNFVSCLDKHIFRLKDGAAQSAYVKVKGSTG